MRRKASNLEGCGEGRSGEKWKDVADPDRQREPRKSRNAGGGQGERDGEREGRVLWEVKDGEGGRTSPPSCGQYNA